MSEKKLRAHFNHYGLHEGRAGSPTCFREEFTKLVTDKYKSLEIGPFTNPCLRGNRVKYFDVLDADALLKRAQEIGYQTSNPPKIDYVSPLGDLSVVDDREFDAVFSSHCIEHQPDLIRHLKAVGDLLVEGGFYLLIIPDKRYMFDHFIQETSLAQVIQANREERVVHTLQSVIEHRAMVAHNDGAMHWRGDHGEMRMEGDLNLIKAAVNEFEEAKGEYVDVHAWQFTPASFRALTGQLFELGYSNLAPARVFNTPRDRIEFCAVLERRERV